MYGSTIFRTTLAVGTGAQLALASLLTADRVCAPAAPVVTEAAMTVQPESHPAHASAPGDARREPPQVMEPQPSPPCSEGSSCRPVPVTAWPFTDSRDTRTSEVREIERYACAAANEGGAEVWYRFTVTEPGSVRARIPEHPRDGIDLDLHLLSAPSSEACIARADEELVADLAPGTYWLVVDTWVNRAGLELAGPYRLTLTFTPTVR